MEIIEDLEPDLTEEETQQLEQQQEEIDQELEEQSEEQEVQETETEVETPDLAAMQERLDKLEQEAQNYKNMGIQEREKRKAAEEYKDKFEKLEPIIQELQNRQKEPERTFEERYYDNPAEATQAELEQLRAKVSEFEKFQGDYAKSQEEMGKQQQLAAQVTRMEQDFQKDNPDYLDALQHIVTIKHSEFQGMGYTPEQIQNNLLQYQQQVTMQCMQNEVNPAEYAYNLAKTMGYQKAENEIEVDTSKLDQAKKNQKAAKNLGTGGQKKPQEMGDEELFGTIADILKTYTR